MTTGNNTTTVSISLKANDMLDILADKHSLTKNAIVSGLVLSMATLDYEQVSTLISSGAIVTILLKLGAKINYPDGMILKDSYAPLPIINILKPTEDKA